MNPPRRATMLPAALLLSVLLPPKVSAGHYEDGIYIPDTHCVYAKDCETASSSDSSPGFTPYRSGESYYGRQTANTLKNCHNPVCMLLVPLCIAADAPFWIVNGLKAGFHYGGEAVSIAGKGVGRGVAAAGRGIGHAVAAPFDRSFKLTEPASSWERYKHDVLALQHWATRQERGNAENELWCKTRVPLEQSPNRAEWERRCNPNGVVRHTGAVSDPVAPEAAAGRTAKAAGCAVEAALRDAAALGAEGQTFASEVEGELRKVLAELRSRPPSGQEGAVRIFTASKDLLLKDAAGERQAVVKVVVQRDEGSGEVVVDALTSVTGPDGREQARQNIIRLDAGGRVADRETDPQAQACLDAPR